MAIDFDALARAVEMQESGGRADAVSPAGARGPMQIMPATAQQPGFGLQPLQNIDDPEANRQFGRQYLQAMIDYFDGDHNKALAAYNAGAGRVEAAVRSHGDQWLDRMPEETRNYVPGVMGRLNEGGEQPQFNINRRQVATQTPEDEEYKAQQRQRAIATAQARRRMAEAAQMQEALQTPEGLSTAQQVLGGFYSEAAKLIGAPVELVNQAFNAAGMELLDQPGDAVAAVNRAFEAVGIANDPGEGLAGKIGRTTFNSLVELGALMAAAPTGGASLALPASRIGQGIEGIRRGLGEIANMARKNPAHATIATVGGSAGAETGAQVAADQGAGPLGQTAAALGGGLVGGGVSTFATSRLPARQARRADAASVPDESMHPRGNPEHIQFGAEARATRYREEIEGRLDAIQQKYAEAPPGQASITLDKELRAVELRSEAFINDLWADVPRAAPVQPQPMFQLARQILADSRNKPSTRPNTKLLNIMLGKGDAPPTTLGGWSEIRSEALNQSKIAYAQGNEGLGGNYARIASGIADELVKQVPSDELRIARDYTRRHHDIFTRGPIGRVTATTKDGGRRVDPKNVAERLMKQSSGMEQVRNASLIGGDKPALRDAAEEAIRKEFGQALKSGNPERYTQSRRTQENLDNFPALADELAQTATTFRNTVNELKSVEMQALQRAAQQDPGVTIDRIFSSSNPAREAATLRKQFSQDSPALNGLRTGLIEEMLRRSKYDGAMLRDMLSNPMNDRMLRAALSSSQVERFKRIADVAYDIQRGNVSRWRGFGKKGFTLLSRVFGAGVGSAVSRATGAGNIQTPHYAASAARDISGVMMQGIPADAMLARAVMDPKFERVLRKRVRLNPRAFRDDIREMQQVLSGMAGTTAAATPDGQQSTR